VTGHRWRSSTRSSPSQRPGRTFFFRVSSSLSFVKDEGEGDERRGGEGEEGRGSPKILPVAGFQFGPHYPPVEGRKEEGTEAGHRLGYLAGVALFYPRILAPPVVAVKVKEEEGGRRGEKGKRNGTARRRSGGVVAAQHAALLSRCYIFSCRPVKGRGGKKRRQEKQEKVRPEGWGTVHRSLQRVVRPQSTVPSRSFRPGSLHVVHRRLSFFPRHNR